MTMLADVYDAVAFRGKAPADASQEVLALVRPFEGQDEKDGHFARFGKTRFGLTFLINNHPTGGWPWDIVKDYPICGLQVVMRAYRGAPEFLPGDFTWTCLDDKGDIYGGILKDATRRT